MLKGRWEFAFVLKDARIAVNLAGRLQEQIGQCGMEIRPCEEFHSGPKKTDILRGYVLAEIERSLGKFEFVEKADATDIAIGLFKIQKLNPGRKEKLAHNLA